MREELTLIREIGAELRRRRRRRRSGRAREREGEVEMTGSSERLLSLAFDTADPWR